MFYRVLCCLVFLSAYGKAEELLSKKQALQKVEQNILALEAEKKNYEKKSIFHKERGRSWQFSKEDFLESRREYFLADRDRDKISLLELKIKNLNLQKKEILEE